ncbi:MAG: PQQ-binding-like beta-propeller repeat protein, partial [Opitutaceae bacterium]
MPALACSILAAAEPVLPVEDAAERAKLPEFQVIAAASTAELTPTNGLPKAESLRTWTVSHGDAGARRYSALDQINRGNVVRLREAWTYRSKDGSGHIQSNPIVVDGVMFAPTVGRAIVAVDAVKGVELWRYQLEPPARLGLENPPARRGLVYWAGEGSHGPRVVFACDLWVYALDPKTGRPLPEFGTGGRTPLPTGGTAVGVIWRNTYIVPGVRGDVFAYDLRIGAQLWRFHTIPRPGEFGADTWQGSLREGAHPWGGLALDEARAIVFVAAGAARPDFIGVGRLGDNLYSNCVIALDARTGARLWHFQNVRHDLWDLDNPAPPNLVTVTRDGRRIDAVACVTKVGNTLLLDRVSGKPLFP